MDYDYASQYGGVRTKRKSKRRRNKGRRTRGRKRGGSQAGGVGKDGRILGDKRRSLERGLAKAKGSFGKFRGYTTIFGNREAAKTNRDLKARSYKCDQSKAELLRLIDNLKNIKQLGKESVEFCQPDGTKVENSVWQLGNFDSKIEKAVKPLSEVLDELLNGMNRHIKLGSKAEQLKMVGEFNKLEAKVDRMTDEIPTKIDNVNKGFMEKYDFLRTDAGKVFLEEAFIEYRGIMDGYRVGQGLSTDNIAEQQQQQPQTKEEKVSEQGAPATTATSQPATSPPSSGAASEPTSVVGAPIALPPFNAATKVYSGPTSSPSVVSSNEQNPAAAVVSPSPSPPVSSEGKSAELIAVAKAAAETAKQPFNQVWDGGPEHQKIHNDIQMMMTNFQLKDYVNAREIADNVVRQIQNLPSKRRPWDAGKFTTLVNALDNIIKQG